MVEAEDASGWSSRLRPELEFTFWVDELNQGGSVV